MSSPSRPPLMTPEALNEIVTLYVGPKRKKYIVHKKILCDQSEFFNAGFNRGFKEATDGEMYLPEDDPATFADFIEYLYRGTLPNTELSGTYTMRRLYCLAEKICMPLLMDQLMDEIMEAHTMRHPGGFDAAPIQYIYNNTHSTSKLRLFASALLAFKIHKKIEGDQKDSEIYLPLVKFCPDLFPDVFRVICMHRESLVNFHGPIQGVKDAFGPCDFHVHSPDEVCYRKSKESKIMENTAKSSSSPST